MRKVEKKQAIAALAALSEKDARELLTRIHDVLYPPSDLNADWSADTLDEIVQAFEAYSRTETPTERTPSDVLREFCDDVDAAGGIYVDGDGRALGGPVADPAWADLATTYLHACEVLGRKPKVAESP